MPEQIDLIGTAEDRPVAGARRGRKPAPRHRDVVFGGIEERLSMLADELEDSHLIATVERLRGLMDELRRGMEAK
jgi:hypothetical protein